MADASETIAAAPETDEELLELLKQREKEEEALAEEAAKTLEPGPCPVCDGAILAAPTFWTRLAKPFVLREPLNCPGCKLQTPTQPTALGWGVGIGLGTALALAGMSTIFTAQRISDPGSQKMTFLLGVWLFASGLVLVYGVHGARGLKPVAQRILGKRRRRADEKAGAGHAPETGGWFQENLEAVVVAVILALIIRHFAMEAFVIPTGSMAPTLLGDHFTLECERCHHTFFVSKSESEFSYEAKKTIPTHCTMCDHDSDHLVTPADVEGGHKILVNKFIYKIRPPKRYEIVVFKYPRAPWRNYIKRLVGLPGERISIRNGDLYVDDAEGTGKLAKKPAHVQDAVWIPVHDAKFERSEGELRFRPVAEGKEPVEVWTFGTKERPDRDGNNFRCDPTKAEGAPTSWVSYNRKIYDSYAYNSRNGTSQAQEVADLRVRVRVTPSPGAVIRLAVLESTSEQLDDGTQNHPEHAVTARFVTAGGSETPPHALEVDGKVQQEAEGIPPLQPGVPTEIALAYADNRGRLQINGETVLTWDDAFAPDRTYNSNVRLGASTAPVTFQHVRIDRDIYYIASNSNSQTDPSRQKVKIPTDAYFVMGDNSPNSEDGRKWGFVRKGHMIGRAFAVFWPLVPPHVKLIR